MDTFDRDEKGREIVRSRMEQDFNAYYPPERGMGFEARIANAAEYTAFQLGQINRKLDKLIDALESKT